MMNSALISTSELASALGDAGLVVLDCSWHLPESGRRGQDDFLHHHIPGARYFDLDAGSDKGSRYVNMLPSAEQFSLQAQALGIDADSQVVVYDAGYVSARVRWMFKVFGHANVRVLDGGLRKWLAEGRPVDVGAAATHERGTFTARLEPGRVADWRETLHASVEGSSVLVDARTSERFTGAMSSGYPGVAGGHIPGAINTPWSLFLDAKNDYAFVPPAEAERVMRAAGIDLDRPVIATCGSGVTAAVVGLMLEMTGRSHYRIYDGSWHEWGQRDDLPRISEGTLTAPAEERRPGTSTRYVHAGREDGASGRPVNPPIVRASTFLFNSVEALDAAAKTPFDGSFYGRLGTPTTSAFEEAMAQAEGAYRSIATPSGLSAIAVVLTATLAAGDHLLIVDSVYEPVRRLCDRLLKKMGISVTFYSPGLGAGIDALVQPNTRMIYLESPGSGTFEVQDIAALVDVARKRGLLTAIDATWATPVFFRPLDHGVDISIHAATKYIAGHSDAVLGVISTTEPCWAAVRQAAQDLGMSAGVEECNLALRGLRTLPVRMERHQSSGLALARWLAARPEVARVLHPALPDSQGHVYWRRDFTGASGLFAIELLDDDARKVNALADRLQRFAIGFSWGGFESLVLPVYPGKHRALAPGARTGPLLRIHAGLEDVSDLQDDLDRAFDAVRSTFFEPSPTEWNS